MANFNTQPVINILGDLVRSNQLDVERIDEAIDTLERIKDTIDEKDDEAIDKVDEVQDYLQYLLTIDEPSMEEIKEELADMIHDLQEQSK